MRGEQNYPPQCKRFIRPSSSPFLPFHFLSFRGFSFCLFSFLVLVSVSQFAPVDLYLCLPAHVRSHFDIWFTSGTFILWTKTTAGSPGDHSMCDDQSNRSNTKSTQGGRLARLTPVNSGGIWYLSRCQVARKTFGAPRLREPASKTYPP